jgi:hypothetical protein
MGANGSKSTGDLTADWLPQVRLYKTLFYAVKDLAYTSLHNCEGFVQFIFGEDCGGQE